MSYEKELKFACTLVADASGIILDHYQREVKISWKGKNDPVTDADEASTKFILRKISEEFPDDAVLIEERDDDKKRFDISRTWIVDPLDGTKEFIARNGEFSVMAGFVVDGAPVLGAVAVPVMNLIYAGQVGGGAFLLKDRTERTAIKAGEPDSASQARLIVSRSHRSSKIDVVKKKLGITREIPCGSVGLKMVKVISGEADLYVHFGIGIKLWDTCAPDAIARAAGVKFTDLTGRDIDYLSPKVSLERGIVVTGSKLHTKVIATLAQVVTE